MKLMTKRDELDALLLAEADRGDATESRWLYRENLLRRQTGLERMEQRHLRNRTKALAERQRLYLMDPTVERAHDLDLVRTLLWQFKRHLGPYVDHHEAIRGERAARRRRVTRLAGDDDGDETSSVGSDTSDEDETGSDASDEDGDVSSEGDEMTTSDVEARGPSPVRDEAARKRKPTPRALYGIPLWTRGGKGSNRCKRLARTEHRGLTG